MILSLDVVKPAADAKEGLVGGLVGLGFRDVHEADALKELGPVGL